MDQFSGESQIVQVLSDFESGDVDVKNVVVQVMAIDRYLIDKTNKHIAIDETVYYLYDVVITDGKSSLKTLLSSDLNYLVQTNQLKRSSVCLLALEEEFFHDKPCLVIKRLQILSSTAKPIGSIEYCLGSEKNDAKTSLETLLLPLTGVRHFFINVWNDAIVEWPLRNPDDDPYISPTNISGRIKALVQRSKSTSLKEMEGCGGKPRLFYPIIVRVISVGKVTHLSKFGDETNCALRGSYVVTDGTAISYMSIWDSLVASLHDKIQLNSILLIQKFYTDNYKGKPNLKFLNVHKDGSKISLTPFEIKVNAKIETEIAKSGHNIYVFKPGDEKLLPDLPYAGYTFYNSSLKVDPNGCLLYDITGVVVTLSRYERILRHGFNDKCLKGVWVLRWVEIVNNPHEPPLRLQIFVNGQMDSHYELRVGDRVVICNMKLVLANENNETYFTSTNETQIIISQNWDQFDSFVEIKGLQGLTDGMIKTFVKSGNGVGGLYPLSVIPKRFDELKEPFYEKIVSNSWWPRIIDNMWFWLSRRIIIQGQIAEINFINLNIAEMEKSESLRLYKSDTIQLKSLKLYGLQKPHRNTFSQKYSENMCRPYQFPVTSYLTSTSMYKEVTSSNTELADFLCDGYYEIVIADGEKAMKCFFLPKPAKHPFPSLKNMLLQEFTPAERKTQDRIHYSKEEINSCMQTADLDSEIGERQTFLIELFKHSLDECEVIFHRMYLAPPEVSTENEIPMAVD